MFLLIKKWKMKQCFELSETEIIDQHGDATWEAYRNRIIRERVLEDDLQRYNTLEIQRIISRIILKDSNMMKR